MPEWPPLRDYSRSRAVLVGTSEYSFLPGLPVALNSLERMAEMLTGPLCGWPADRVARLTNEHGPGDLPDRLITWFEGATDVALFYYVGHGQVDWANQLCLGLVGSRTEPNRRAATSLPFEAIRRAMLDSPAATKIVILDCCSAGVASLPANSLAASPDDILDKTAGSGAYTMAASAAYSPAWYDTTPGAARPQTFFTQYLVDLVENGIPGQPAGLRLHPLFIRLRDRLANDKRPVPVERSVDAAREFVFAHNAAPPEVQRDLGREVAELTLQVEALTREIEHLQGQARSTPPLPAEQRQELDEAIGEAQKRLDETAAAQEAATTEAGKVEQGSFHAAETKVSGDAEDRSPRSGNRLPPPATGARENTSLVPHQGQQSTTPLLSTGQSAGPDGDMVSRKPSEEGLPQTRRRTVVLAISGAGIVAAASTLTALLLPSTHSTGSLTRGRPTSPASETSTPASGSSATLAGTINADGSTFQTNFQQAAIQAFKVTQPGVTVNYGSGGSSAGRTALYSNTVLFAGSDSPIPASEASKVPAGKTVLYFPVQIGPIALAYNLAGMTGLKLDATVLAGIFQGTIKTWDDPAIKALNYGSSLPSTAITPVVRSDSSGTTANFSQYLVDAAGSAWKLGAASTISFPSSAHAASGGSGIAQAVKATYGSIGYVDFSTAQASGLSAASIKNKAGDFVAPSPTSAAAAASQVTPKANLTFSTVDEPGAGSYPVTYQSWDLVYAQQPSTSDAVLLKAYLGYLLGDGQQLLTPLDLAPLPSSIDQAAVAQLDKITS